MNQLDKIDQAHKDGYKAGLDHAEPSKKTLKLFENMEKEIKQIPYIMAKLENIIEIVTEGRDHSKKTNGRVMRLETWRAYLLGGWAATTAIIVVLFPICFFYFIDNFRYEMRDMIRDNVTTAIDTYAASFFEETN